MKILLVSPACGKWKGIGRHKVFNGKTFRFSMLSLLTVAELSPADAEITIVDEQVEDIPFAEQFDVVGITAMTATAPRAYEIAARFRQRDIPVVLGGFHGSLNTEEAVGHVDAVVVGTAFDAWPKLLSDVQSGRLEKVYYGNPDGRVPASLPRHLLSGRKYVTINATYATLGCKNRCHFCSISAFHKARHYTRDADEVAEEVGSFDKRFFMFVDDNLTQDREYIFRLLPKLAPLKKKWVTQASVDIADDDELLGLMRDAGCVGVFVGLESFNGKALASQNKTIKAPELYRQAVKKLHSYGMFVESGIIFGFDDDDVTVFRSTFNMLEDIGIDAVQISILTPVSGTGLYEEMKDRISDANWEHYDYRRVVFEPRRMSAEQLQAGTDWVIRRFYSPARIFKRWLRWLFMPGGWRNFIYLLLPNLAYYGRTKRFGIKGYDPSETLGGRYEAEIVSPMYACGPIEA